MTASPVYRWQSGVNKGHMAWLDQIVIVITFCAKQHKLLAGVSIP